MAQRTLAVLLLLVSTPGAATEANGLATAAEARHLSWYSPSSWYSSANDAADQAKAAAKDVKEKADKAAADAKELAASAKETAANAKKAAEEAAKDPTTTLLKAALKAAGTCPTIVSASRDFLKNSIPDLVDKVAKELVGDCKELKSEGCGKRLSDLSSGLLVESTEQAMGVPAAKTVIKQTDQLTSTVGKFTVQAKCNVDAVNGGLDASETLKKGLPDGAMDNIKEVSENVNLMDDTIKDVIKMLAPAKQLVTMWDTGKKVIKEVLAMVGSKAIAQVQPHIPPSVQETVNKEKDKFIAKMVDYLQTNLGDALTKQIEKYCPDASSSSGDEGDAAKLGDSLDQMAALQESIQKKLDDAEQKVKDEMKVKIIGLVDTMKEKFPPSTDDGESNGASEALTKVSSDIKSCNEMPDPQQKFVVVPELSGNDFPMKYELEGLRDILDDDGVPATQKEHFAKLYLQGSEARASTRKLRAENQRLAEALSARPSSTSAASPPSFGVLALSVVSAAALLAGVSGVIMVIRRRQQSFQFHGIDDTELA